MGHFLLRVGRALGSFQPLIIYFLLKIVMKLFLIYCVLFSAVLAAKEPLPVAKVMLPLGRSWSHRAAVTTAKAPVGPEFNALPAAPTNDVAISAHAGHKVPQVVLQSSGHHLLNVTLPGNPTTGFSWSVLPEFDTTVVEQKGDYLYTRSNNLIGGGGHFKFTFAAKAPGSTKITFYYNRPWERHETIDETEAVEVPVLVV